MINKMLSILLITYCSYLFCTLCD